MEAANVSRAVAATTSTAEGLGLAVNEASSFLGRATTEFEAPPQHWALQVLARGGKTRV